MKPMIYMCAAVLVLSGCTTTESMRWVGIDGSKAGGTVVLGIHVPPKIGIRETIVEWDIDQANS